MTRPKQSWTPRLFLLLGLACAAALAAWGWRGRGYYLLPMAERPLSAGHEFLRSSGRGGLSLGVIGTALIFLNLTYLVRRQFIRQEWLGSLRSWMSFHVFTGLVGPVLIALHSAFLLRSALASIAALALMVVVFTGVVGRYIYARTPRSVKGKELALEDLRRGLAVYREDLKRLGMPLEALETSLPAPLSLEPPGLLAQIAALIKGDRQRSQDFRALSELVDGSPALRAHREKILPLADRYFQERRWVARYHELRSLMSGWRFFHRWFAVVMLIIAAFHILVALLLGDLSLGDWTFD